MPLLRGFQWDLARQLERLDVLLDLLPRYAEWGYNELYLHLEDAVQYPSLPAVARADAYSYRDFQKLVETATRHGIGVVPIVNLLGHTQYLIKVPELRELNELQGPDGTPLEQGQICPLHPRTLEIADKLLGDMKPFCTAGKVHVGLDESFHLAKCPRCRAEVAKHGLGFHFASHVRRLHTLTTARGLRLGMWADMLNFVPEAIPLLPKDIIAYDWYYYAFKRHPKNELFNFSDSNLAAPLIQHGIEYWGCPMNGAFRFEPMPLFGERLANIRSWWDRCHRVGAAGMLITSWEAYRLAFELPAAVDAAAADLWLESGAHTDKAMLSRGFQRLSGLSSAAGRRHAATAVESDKYPFAGYARWEVNERWDVAAPEDSLTRWKAELRSVKKLARQARGCIPAVKFSLQFRAYLAERDLFVRETAATICRLRARLWAGEHRVFCTQLAELRRRAQQFEKTLQQGRAAAKAMWRLSRKSAWRNQNLDILERDETRLQQLHAWLNAVAKDSGLIAGSSPVLGVWQFSMIVVNRAPAMQRVVLEEQREDGAWREVRGRYTIDFQAIATQPRADMRHWFAASLETPDRPLRLVLQGLGEVWLENLSISNGVETRPLGPQHKPLHLGRPAPKSGFPDVRAVQGVIEL
jgi:hypothetical protein